MISYLRINLYSQKEKVADEGWGRKIKEMKKSMKITIEIQKEKKEKKGETEEKKERKRKWKKKNLKMQQTWR